MFKPGLCYSNAISFGLELVNRELAKALNELPKRKRTKAVRARLAKNIEQRVFVVHGTIKHDFGHRTKHAWVEYDNLAYDPTLSIVALVEEWYQEEFFSALVEGRPIRVGHAIADARYPVMVAMRTALRHTTGPWSQNEVEW